jgi:hypothetical protein
MDFRQGYLTQKKREEIFSLMESSGYDPDIARGLTDMGLIALEKRLKERDASFYERPWANKRTENTRRDEKTRPPLKFGNLPKDQGRVNKLEIEKLEKQEKEIFLELADFESQIDAIRDDNEDRISELEQTKMRMQDNLRQKQEEIARLRSKKIDG